MDADELLVENVAAEVVAAVPPTEDAEPEEGTMLCIACSFQIATFAERTAHYSTEWHRYNVKRRCAGLLPIAQPQFEEKIAALEQQKAQQEVTFRCDPCSKTFHTDSAYQQHISSKKHQKKLKGGSNHTTPKTAPAKPNDAAALPAVQLASPAAVPAAAPASNDVAADSKAISLPPPASAAASSSDILTSAASLLPASSSTDQKSDDPSAPVKITDAPADGDATAEEDGGDVDGEEVGIPLKQCLFCNREPFKTVKASLDHMLKQHGFFIPFVEILRDLDGLLLYLGEKIGVGHVCLYCNGRGKAAYSSTQACQQHMRDKFHCKIRFEEDEEDDEFIEFYDFPTEEDSDNEADVKMPASLPPLSSDVQQEPAKKARFTSASVLPSGELDVGNGRILGHRSLQTYYKQNLKPEMEQVAIRPALEYQPKRSNTLVAHLAGQYRSMQLVGWRRAAETEKVFRKFMRQQNKAHMKLGIAANKLQHHYRAQVMF